MLISIGIIATLSGIMLVYNNSSGQRTVLLTERAKVMGVLSRAKSLALQGYKANSASYCAFGVSFEANGNYSIVGVPTPATGDCITAGVLPATDLIEPYSLDIRTDFKTFPPQNAVFFEAPYLTTYNDGTITLEIKGASPALESSIEVSGGGSISAI